MLLLLSVASFAIAVERFLLFRSRSDDLRGSAAMLDAHLRNGSRDEAIAALQTLRSSGAAVALGFTAEVLNLADQPAFDFFGVQRPGRAFFFKTTLTL